MVQTIKNGDIGAFEVLYQAFHQKVYAFVRKHSRNGQAAEDLTHDVFLKVWQNRQSLSDTIPVDAQLLHTARQLVINQYKQDLVRQKALSVYTLSTPWQTRPDETTNLLVADELQIRYKTALAQLPDRRREIFELSRFEQLSYDEIAEKLAISRATVESQMVKALKFLRERLTMLLWFF